MEGYRKVFALFLGVIVQAIVFVLVAIKGVPEEAAQATAANFSRQVMELSPMILSVLYMLVNWFQKVTVKLPTSTTTTPASTTTGTISPIAEPAPASPVASIPPIPWVGIPTYPEKSATPPEPFDLGEFMKRVESTASLRYTEDKTWQPTEPTDRTRFNAFVTLGRATDAPDNTALLAYADKYVEMAQLAFAEQAGFPINEMQAKFAEAKATDKCPPTSVDQWARREGFWDELREVSRAYAMHEDTEKLVASGINWRAKFTNAKLHQVMENAERILNPQGTTEVGSTHWWDKLKALIGK